MVLPFLIIVCVSASTWSLLNLYLNKILPEISYIFNTPDFNDSGNEYLKDVISPLFTLNGLG